MNAEKKERSVKILLDTEMKIASKEKYALAGVWSENSVMEMTLVVFFLLPVSLSFLRALLWWWYAGLDGYGKDKGMRIRTLTGELAAIRCRLNCHKSTKS